MELEIVSDNNEKEKYIALKNASAIEKYENIKIESIMHNAYLQYSLSVNVGRAIPDIRDGLKCSSRRILYAMHVLGLNKSHSYTKSAKVVGEVIGNYHPHGDASVYEALVRMAQNFTMRYPLIDGQGNFGSIDGDPPAAYRYTECRMERLTEELLQDIDKNTVNMIPNFDGSRLEPEILPAKIPNLLINGSTGIGVGMATNIPPHNLREIIDALLSMLEDPNISIADINDIIKGPDFPTSAIIRGTNGINELYNTGHGTIKIRCKAETIEQNNKEMIIIKELPYSVNKENLVKNIAELVKNKKIDGIITLRDETSKRIGLRIVIELKKNISSQIVLNQLYKHTQLETSLACTFLVVDGNQPKIMNIKQILQRYIDHRIEIITNRTIYDLNKSQNRIEILNGLLIAINNINAIIKIIKTSENKKNAIEKISENFSLSNVQSNAILEMKLHQLTNLAMEDLQNECIKLKENIDYFNLLLSDKKILLKSIIKELIEIKNKYTKENDRKTLIDTDISDQINMIDLVPNYNCVIILSDNNYVQKINSSTFRTQHRGGKGTRGMNMKNEDFAGHIITANNYDKILFFTNRGLMYQIDAYKIPESLNKTNKGKAIINLINIKNDEKISTILPIEQNKINDDDLFLIFTTKKGYIKKTRLSKYNLRKKVGLKAIKIQEKDKLVDVAISTGNSDIFLSSAMGMACKFNENEAKPIGRTSQGVYGIRFKVEDDYVNNMLVLPNKTIDNGKNNIENKNAEKFILSILNTGIGKKSLIKNYRLTHRGTKGVINIKLKSNERVISTLQVEKNDEIILIAKSGQIIRIPVNEIRTVGRMARGVKIVNLNNDYIVKSSKVLYIEDNEESKV